jgi:hypothetical protein
VNPSPLTRRESLRVGGLSALGLSLPQLLRNRAAASESPKRAKSCIVVFLMGGPPQHSTWDPKPNAPAEVRGEFGPTETNVPGVRICSLLPKLAKQADKLCILRGVSTGDNAHSSSGYAMLTGVPHAPLNAEGVNPGPPNDSPSLAAIVRRLRGDRNGLPGSVRLPMHIFNTDSSVWPGQDAGFLGRATDPWLFRCEPASPKFGVPELTLQPEVSVERFGDRRTLFQKLDRSTTSLPFGEKAFDLLNSAQARAAFDMSKEKPQLRDRYGRHHFGQSCLLARRLVEAGVGLVQVNWYRGPDEPSDAPCWDSHAKESNRLKNALCPPADGGISTLLEDLSDRGLLADTLVMCISEFGRSPKFNGAGGRDHWGRVFSVALAGGGIKGGQVVGASDEKGAGPAAEAITPDQLAASFYHTLGIDHRKEYHTATGRPVMIVRDGSVIRPLFG